MGRSARGGQYAKALEPVRDLGRGADFARLGRSAALQILAIGFCLAVVCALHLTPIRQNRPRAKIVNRLLQHHLDHRV